jgi:hypothetical protein
MLIAYQSFNSNSAYKHDLRSATYQPNTMLANDYVTTSKHKALVLPYDPKNFIDPIEGPAQLVPIAKLPPRPAPGSVAQKRKSTAEPEPANKRQKTGDGAASSIKPAVATSAASASTADATPMDVETEDQPDYGHTANVFGGQIALVWQNFYRVFGEMPSIMMCGELDTSNVDFGSIIPTTVTKTIGDKTETSTVIDVETVVAKRACQSFTGLSRSITHAKKIGSGIGYVIYSLNSLNIVFVHVPNKICTDEVEVKKFYGDIARSLNQGGKIIHLVIGDTNQSRLQFTEEALNAAFNTTAYKNAFTSGSVKPVDNFGNQQYGTNAKGDTMFDVAVYRSDILDLVSVAYVSQSSTGITITDHYGVGIKIKLK